MDFAALLIVIELDEFLMCYPGQVYARKHFKDDFLQHKFTAEEVQLLIKIDCISYFTSWLALILGTIEWVFKVVTKWSVMIVVISVNMDKMTHSELVAGNYIFWPPYNVDNDSGNEIPHTGITDTNAYDKDTSNDHKYNVDDPNSDQIIEVGPCYMGFMYCD